MAIKYGFFNSVNGDRTYNADDISNYFLKLISNGVFATPSNSMQVQENSGMTVQVSAGWGFINCKWIDNTAPYLLTLDASDVVLDRIDRVVIRLNASNDVRTMSIAIKKGTASSSPQPPTLTRVTGGIWEISLAQIYIAAGSESITQANITDERADTSVCGYVTGLIDQIDTTNLFAQFTNAFNTWFDEIKEEVQTTTIVVTLRSSYSTTTAGETDIPINISQYNTTLDILNVYINGMRATPGVDYTNDGSYIYLTNALSVVGSVVDIEILKSMDTSDAQSIAQFVLQLNSRVQTLENTSVSKTQLETRLNGLSFIKLTKVQYDNLPSYDQNTIYYVVDGNKITQYMGNAQLSSGTQNGVMTSLQQGFRGGSTGAATNI